MKYILQVLLWAMISHVGFSQVTGIQMSGPSTVNQGQAAQFTIQFFSEGSPVGPPFGAGYFWQYPGGNPGTMDISQLSVTFPNPGTYTVYYEISDVMGTFFASRNITVNSTVSPCLSVIPSAPERTIGSAQSVVMTANTAPSGFTYRWFDSNGTTILSNSQSYTTPSLSANKTYYLAYVHTGTACITAKVPIRVNVYNENETWIRKYAVRDSVLLEQNLRGSVHKVAYKETDYFDGLGRPMQKVAIAASVNGNDMITPIVYDAIGREYRSYLPYPNTAASVGNYKSDALTKHASYYTAQFGDSFGYSESQYEASPLSRVTKQSNPGNAWRMGSGRELEFNEKTNNANEDVRIWTVNASGFPVSSAAYTGGSLWRKESRDENKQRVVEYFDKLNRLILKKVQVADTVSLSTHHDGWMCTYQVYDDFGRLRVVIPPKAVGHLKSQTWATATSTDATFANAQYYRYSYDERGRMVSKQLPGKGLEEMVYDLNDRLVAYRDARMAAANQWQYTKYDALNRVVMTGIVTHTITRASLQTLVNGLGNNNAVINATSGKTGTTNAGGYPTASHGNGETLVLTVMYYDHYVFRKSTLTHSLPGGYGPQSNKTHGLLTGKLVRNMDTGVRYETAIYYDAQGRVIQTMADHHVATGTIRVSTKYDFENKPVETITQYGSTHTITRGMTYNNAGQLIQTSHRIGTGATVTLASLQYNDLGQVTKKTFPGASNAEINFTYNIRGWLRKINDPALSNSATKLFAQELLYETGATTNNWNGNISGVYWLGRDDTLRQYRYAYDPANRITAATYTVPTVTAENTRYNVSGITYDLNGNITAMQRRNQMTATTYGLVDNLTYTYDTHGNRLLQVADAVAGATHTSKDFKERSATNYGYDVNGNLTANADKEITAISYFHHNLPREITLSGTNRKVVYQYDAEGNKVRETQHNGGTSTIRDYVGEFVLVGGAMDYLIHEEGKVSYESGVPKYEFFVKDHLGNVRQVIRAPEQAMRVATMEPDRAEEEEEEFGNIKESRQPAAAHNTTPGGYATAWLNAARNRTLGPNRTQEVQEGDSITLMVEGKYLDIKAGAIRPKDLLQPVEGAPASPLLTDLGQPISAGGINQFLLFKALHLLITGLQQKPAPEAYLGYALYDADSNLYDQGRIVLSKKARNRHEELKTRIFVPKDGYIEAYVVNESEEDVWFDQFRILSTGPVIVQETHYDPWGVELQGLGYQQGGLKVNKYLYQGKEFQDGLNLNVYDFHARGYDPSIGRTMQMDPRAEFFYDYSPYSWVKNNPVARIDPTGMTDFTFNKKTGEMTQVGKKNDDPDRILKTNRKDEVKHKKNGEPKVALGDIEKGILENGQNWKTEDQIIKVGGENEASLEGVEDFLTRFSEYLNVELSGAYLSQESKADAAISRVYVDEYQGNTAMKSSASFTKLITDPSLKGFNTITDFHTHPTNVGVSRPNVDRPSGTNGLGGDLAHRDSQKSYFYNFLILTRTATYPYNLQRIDYTNW
jgi:RHS repeat-associated protein